MIRIESMVEIYSVESKFIPFKISATENIDMIVADFFITPSQARLLVIVTGSIRYCFPTHVMKSIIIRSASIPICCWGICKYSKIAMAPRYQESFVAHIMEDASTDIFFRKNDTCKKFYLLFVFLQ